MTNIHNINDKHTSNHKGKKSRGHRPLHRRGEAFVSNVHLTIKRESLMTTEMIKGRELK